MRKNKKDKKQDINYLDLIPETNQSIRWHRDLKQRIILEIENKGMFNTIAQKVFGKPRFSKVHLDEMGTFIWPEIDGTKTVQDLALLVKEHFGDKAEPLYPRIVKYFQIMESYASKNPVLPSIFDGIGMGLGFTVGLTAIGIVRELLGAGEVFGIRVMPQSYEPLTIFVLAPGAFFVLACLVALQNKVKANLEKKGKKVPVSSGCGEGCSACASKGICGGHLAENEPHHEETNVKEEEEA